MYARYLPLAALALLAAAPTQESQIARKTEQAWSAAVRSTENEKSCAKAIGVEPAKALVRYCRYVSGATHPPCNTANSCALITGHIDESEGGDGKLDPDKLPGLERRKPGDWSNIAKLGAL